MHHRVNHRVIRRVLVAAVVVAASGALATTSNAAGPSVSVATSLVYGVNGPDTPLPVSITVANESASLVVSAGGYVTAASCDAPFVAVVDFGEVTVTHATDPTFAASTVVACDLDLGLGLTGATTVDLVISERDGFNTDLGTTTTGLSLEGIDVTTTVGAVSLTGGTYAAAEPRSVGDELTRSVTFDLAASRSIEARIPAGTTASGCPATTAATTTCDLARTLSVADLAAGTAAMAPTLYVDGWPVALADADVTVPSQRRLLIEATAVAPIVRAGEVVTVDATIENIGTIDLTALALGGAGFTTESATCGSDPIGSITLTPGSSTTCRIARRVTTTDVGTTTAMTVRATAPFGDDSDLIDDDPTSASDVDAATIDVPFTVIAADASGALTTAPGVAFIDDAGTDDLAMTVSLLSAGALSNAVVTLPVAPHQGVTITGCDEVSGADCRLLIGDVTADTPITRSVNARVDGSAIDVAGLVDAAVTAQLSASGGVTASLTPTALSTAGSSVIVDTTELDVSGDDMVVDVTVSGRPGLDTTVTLGSADARSFTIDECRRADTSLVTVLAVGDDYSLGAVGPTDSITCSVRRAVVDADRTDAATTISLSIGLEAGAGTAERTVGASIPTRSLRVENVIPAADPELGYSLDGADDRPNVTGISFDVVVRDDAPTTVLPRFAGSDAFVCTTTSAANSTRFACTGEHRITQADLDAGLYTWDLTVDVDGFGPLTTRVEVPVLHRRLDVTVTELSTPLHPDGYRLGDEIRLLVQMRNRGTMTLTLLGLQIPSQIRAEQYEVLGIPMSLQRRDTQGLDTGCLSQIELAPAETLDCGLTVTVQDSTSGGAFEFVLRADDTEAAYTLTVTIDPMATPVPSTDELPATGGGRTGSLVASAFALVVVGIVLTGSSRRRPARVPVPARRAGQR